jgi:hypothetical protein
VRTIGESLGIAPSTGYSRLVETLGFKNYILRWIPHILTAELRQKRVEFARQLLEVLENQRIIGFAHLVTGDESWFLRHYERECMWCLSADEVPTRVKPTIATPKTMLLSKSGNVLHSLRNMSNESDLKNPVNLVQPKCS